MFLGAASLVYEHVHGRKKYLSTFGELRPGKDPLRIKLEAGEESAAAQAPEEQRLSHFFRRFDGPKCCLEGRSRSCGS